MSQTHLGGAGAELGRNECGFYRSHDQDRKRQRHCRPQNGVHPKWRIESEFDPKGQTNDDGAQHHDYADRAGVTGIGTSELEPAYGASGTQGQQTREQLAFAAPRTAAP